MASYNDILMIKKKVEVFSKQRHIEILRILSNNSNIKLSENKSGVYANLSYVPVEVIEELKQYIEYVETQEKMLEQIETEQKKYKNNEIKAEGEVV